MATASYSASKNLKHMAGWLTLLISLLPPIAYFIDASFDTRNNLKRDTHIINRILSDQIDWNQSVQSRNLHQIIEKLPLPERYIQIHSLDQTLVFQSASLQPRSPHIEAYATLMSAEGKPRVRIQASTSLRPALMQSGILLCASTSIALFIMWLFRSLPVRLIEQFERERLELQARLEFAEQEKNKALLKLQSHNDELNHMASHDQLTGLFNRQHFENLLCRQIEHCKKTGESFAIILFDLDQFKDINDTLGHHSGDIVLREIAQRMHSSFGQTYTLARFGGDEFGIIIEHYEHMDKLRSIANRILEQIERPFTLQGYTLDTTASMGMVFFPDHGDDADMLLQHADVAMYEAKHKKKHLVIYHPEKDLNSLSHLTMRGELRTAIDKGDLQVHYQPKISFSTGQISGVEALVRWSHPERGFVSPTYFIPVAEQTGLIHPLTSLVFNVSLNQAAEWQTRNLPISLAINLSTRSLHDKQLPLKIHQLLETWKVPAPLLTLEITESAIMAEPDRALAILSDIASMGIKISVDDYGTGFSSLSYIKRLPIQEIKIDRSFVTDMAHNENDSIIVRATIDMAHDLGLKVTAEGVESEAAMDMLHEYGCDNVQGFYVSRPMDAGALGSWLTSSQYGFQHRLISGE